MDQKQLEELKAKHPDSDLHEIGEGDFAIVVKRPGRAAWKRFKAMVVDEKRRADAAEVLVIDCIVHPDRTAWMALLERRPALADTYAGTLAELAGAAEEVEKKAL